MENIEKFLSVSCGCGCGRGYGNGYGVDNGYGYGDGQGHGDGEGGVDGKCKACGYAYWCGIGDGDGNGTGKGKETNDGEGSGYGWGYDHMIAKFDGNDVYYIDNIPTCLISVHGNYAKGFTIKDNYTKAPCYVAKVGNFFAHGETMEQAMADVQYKYDRKKPVEERIADFVAKYPTLDTEVSNRDLFVAHNTLTGSCLFGRQQFVEKCGINLDGSMSVEEFITLTMDEYGGNTIGMLAEEYNERKK